MSMNGKMVDGEVLEKDKARSIYESIVRQMKDPGLLEYVDRRLFRARVFPIPANGDVRVALSYDEQLKVDHGHSRYQYPLDTGKYSAGDYKNVVIHLTLRSAVPIRSLRCSSHDVEITRASDVEARVTFEAKTLVADKDFVIDWNVSEDALAPMVLTYRGSEAQPFFLFSVSPKVDRIATTPPKDIVFVLDTSGSMLGPKMEDARRAVKYCVRSLNAGDRFNVVDFSSEARRFRDGLVLAVDDEKASASTYVDEVVRVSKRYGVLTPYTSYLIVEDERRQPVPRVGSALRPVTEVLRRAREAAAADAAASGESLEEQLAKGPRSFSKRTGASSVRVSKKLKVIKEGELRDVGRFVNGKMNRGEARVRHVAGKTFYSVRGQWIDTHVDSARLAGIRKIKYFSDEYFALLKAQPGIGRILSLGSQVAFLWKGEAYVVTELSADS